MQSTNVRNRRRRLVFPLSRIKFLLMHSNHKTGNTFAGNALYEQFKIVPKDHS